MPFHNKSEMNTPQAEGNVNLCLYSRGHSSNKLHEEYDYEYEYEGICSTLFSNNKNEHKCVIFFLLYLN